jgi:hypothetical protein
MIPSMSRRGNCYDNAPMESFWGTLKNELVHHRRYETREQARREITEYIEIFYNRQRRHARLGNRSPAAFAQQWARHQSAASDCHSWRPLLTAGVISARVVGEGSGRRVALHRAGARGSAASRVSRYLAIQGAWGPDPDPGHRAERMPVGQAQTQGPTVFPSYGSIRSRVHGNTIAHRGWQCCTWN